METNHKTQSPDPTSWPLGVRGITFDEVGGLGLDDDGQLYWHGKPVEQKSGLS